MQHSDRDVIGARIIVSTKYRVTNMARNTQQCRLFIHAHKNSNILV